MSNFYTFDFEYDGVPSKKFDLKIISFDSGGVVNGIGSSDVSIIEQRVLRKSKPYYLGRTQETKLEFPLTFGSFNPISGMERDMISAWLFGRSEYKKLFILQDDLNGAYFNCFLTKPEPIYIGNINFAFTCQVICDSPWAYGPEKTVSGSVVGGIVNGEPDYTFDIYNNSSEDEYLYPTVHFVAGHVFYPSIGMHFILRNFTDNRTFTFSELQEGDDITVNNDLQIVTGVNSNSQQITGLLSRFEGKQWLRLLPKYNSFGIYLSWTGEEIRLFEITYTERFKIGG